MSRAAALGVAALLALALAVPARAQDAGRSPADTGLTEEVRVHLLQMPILVTDRQGRPVAGLSADEIRVSLRGARARVAFLEPARPRTSADTGVAQASLALELPKAPPAGEAVRTGSSAAEAPLLATSAGGGESWLFFIDVATDPPLRRHEALAQLVAFARGLRPSVGAAVMLYNGASTGPGTLLMPFSTDRAALARALERAFSDEGRIGALDQAARTTQLVSRLEDCVVGDRNAGPSDVEVIRRGNPSCLSAAIHDHIDEYEKPARDWIAALSGAVQYAGGLDGRKNVLAVSHGPIINLSAEITAAAGAVFGGTSLSSFAQMTSMAGVRPRVEYDRLLDAAQRLGVALSFVDRSPAPTQDTSARRGQAFAPGERPYLAAYQQAQADLTEAAAVTGGVFRASTDLGEGLRAAAEAIDGGYVLGITLDTISSGRDLSRIKVECTRRGARVQYRRAHVVHDVPGIAALAGRLAFGAPGPPQEAAENASAPGAAKRFRPFELFVEPRQVGYRAEPGATEYRATLTVSVSLFDAAGRRLVEAYDLVTHAFDRGVFENDRSIALRIPGWIEAPPGTYTVVAKVRNVDTGWQGRLAQAVTLPAS